MKSSFVQTGTILDTILERKVEEVAASKRTLPPTNLRDQADAARRTPLDGVSALRGNTVRLIAEVKKASPSKGVLIEDFDPLALATTYTANGAAAISVLTDAPFFQGSLEYLAQIRQQVNVPLLRKDFIIDPYQIDQTYLAGADLVLLIVAALAAGQMADLYAAAVRRGLTPLVEVHNEAEMDRALKLNPALIGINNRDLTTFEVDLQTTARLAKLAPSPVTLVAESGLKAPEDVRTMGELGAHAVLIGEGLVTAPDVGAAVRAFSSQPRHSGDTP
jgi:indole-3-glycerol phosphate synthase